MIACLNLEWVCGARFPDITLSVYTLVFQIIVLALAKRQVLLMHATFKLLSQNAEVLAVDYNVKHLSKLIKSTILIFTYLPLFL